MVRTMPLESAATNRAPDKGAHVFGRPLVLVAIVFYKSLWGAAEVAAGIIILLSRRIIANELAEDPTDLLANWLLARFPFGRTGTLWLGVVLIALGTVNVVLAAGIWYRSWYIRNVMLAFFSLVAVFGAYHLSANFSWLKAGALLADIGIAIYFWKILPKHLRDSGIR